MSWIQTGQKLKFLIEINQDLNQCGLGVNSRQMIEIIQIRLGFLMWPMKMTKMI